MSSSVPNFDPDYQNMIDDAQAYQDAIAAEAQLKQAYLDEYKDLVQKYKDPEQLFYALMALISGNGFAEMDGQQEINGYNLKIQGDVNKCLSDIQSATGANSTATVGDVAWALSKVLSTIDASSSGTGGSIGASIRQALGTTDPNAQCSIFDNLKAMRADINDPYDSCNNLYGPPSGGSYHFSVDVDETHISSYQEMADDLAKPGDPKGATEAAKVLSDNFNQANAATNASQSATQVMVQNQSKLMQTIQSFDKAMMQAVSSVITQSIQASARG